MSAGGILTFYPRKFQALIHGDYKYGFKFSIKYSLGLIITYNVLNLESFIYRLLGFNYHILPVNSFDVGFQWDRSLHPSGTERLTAEFTKTGR